ncbi:MAG: N-acetyl-gamma-glutamyl-phosphate reductase [Candidatus Aminicenantes bacterium RBG_16_63_16]|nr:MAG: N-acetyl-gamma-glutamyl-phosphate reductase [Candidatus Aminicenantes bacterium RBG_16_63_16]
MSARPLDVTIVGGSGYAGGELLRILLFHPGVKVKQVTSQRHAGQPVAILHPNLRGLAPLTFCRPEEVEPCDVLFLGLPNGESMRGMEGWLKMAERIIDLGADFRLGSAEAWKKWYGSDHAAPHLLPRFVYGVPEIYPDEIRNARYIAGPGCEAIVSLLCLYPLVKHGLIAGGPVIIDAKMGSSQAGHTPTEASHHPERAGAVRSYKPTGHRHAAEIGRVLEAFGAPVRLEISATAIEMVRGILVTIHTHGRDERLEEKAVWAALRAEYAGKPFVRIVKQAQGLYRYPEPKILQGTNICEIGFEKERESSRLVMLGAIDNLVKGTSGNAVQCLNLMCGFPETAGLEFPGLHPV